MRLARLVLFAVLSGIPVYAQASTGLLVINLQDPAGAVIPAAKVTITDQATGVATDQETSAQGLARFVSVKPGVYTVSAAASGFN